MARKKIVSAEWHKEAMDAMRHKEDMKSFMGGLRIFLCTKLSPEQQKQLESEISDWIEMNT